MKLLPAQKTSSIPILLPRVVLFAFLLLITLAASAQPSGVPVKPGVSAQPPYTFAVFAQSVKGEYTAPDSITFNATSIYIGYGNGGQPNGSSAIPSTIVQYDYQGHLLNKVFVVGHNDGLKINPQTGDLWSMQNEDASATLLILDPTTLRTKQSYYIGTGQHGGGYDDIVFLNGNVYFSCSNPSNNPNTKPAIVQFTASGHTFTLTPVLIGNAFATDIPTGQQVQLNLQDPDSMTFNFGGDIVLDSQGDGELVVVRHPGASDQKVFRVLLTVGGQGTTVDDTDFVTSSSGFFLVADTAGDAVYSITAPFIEPGAAYSASDSGGFVGALNFGTGVLTPVMSGMVSPHGMAFIPQN